MPESASEPQNPGRDDDEAEARPTAAGPGEDGESAEDDDPIPQAGMVVGHRADDEPIITDADPDPERQSPTTSGAG